MGGEFTFMIKLIIITNSATCNKNVKLIYFKWYIVINSVLINYLQPENLDQAIYDLIVDLHANDMF